MTVKSRRMSERLNLIPRIFEASFSRSASIVAMFVYALLAWALVQLVWILLDRPGQSTVVRETTVVEQPAPPPQQSQPRLR